MTLENDRTWLAAKQVAERFDVSTATIWRWARETSFPNPVKLGDNCTRWRLADLLEWEAQREEVA